MSSIGSVSTGTDPFQATNLTAFVQFVNNFNAIGNALNAGSLPDAQSAVATFQQGLSAGASSQPFGANAGANTDFKSLSSALQNGDLAGARKAYASLQDDLQGTRASRGHHHHHAAETSAAEAQDASTTDTASPGSGLLDVTA
jgi:hypothetical protein